MPLRKHQTANSLISDLVILISAFFICYRLADETANSVIQFIATELGMPREEFIDVQ